MNNGFIKQFGTIKSAAGVISLNPQYVSGASVFLFCHNLACSVVDLRK